MDIQEVSNFKDVMGFNAATNDVFYEDDAADTTIPDIQKVTRKNNILPLWGNVQTMNLNTLVLENIVQSTYWKNYLVEITTFQEVCDDVFVHVRHLEPWERGTRKITGMTGMCGGVRGVGAGGVISTAFCLLYKLFTLRLTRKQLVSMINSRQSIYLRGIGFMFIRFTQPPADLWAWIEPYLDDDAEIDPRSGGGDKMPIGQLVRMMLTKLDFYGTLFPRIPIPIQKDIENKFRERAKLYGYEDDRYGRRRSRSRSAEKEQRRSSKSRERKRTRSRERQKRSRSRDHRHRRSRSREGKRRRSRSRDRNSSRGHDELSKSSDSAVKAAYPKSSDSNIKRTTRQKCSHHLRHHHCVKHRHKCPSKAMKMKRKEMAEQMKAKEENVQKQQTNTIKETKAADEMNDL